MVLSLSCVCMWIFFCLLNLLCVYTGSGDGKPEFKGRRKYRTEGCEQEIIRYNHILEGIVNWIIKVKYGTWDGLDAEFTGGEEGMLMMQTQWGQGEEVMIQCKHRAD
jgi:hypothetical protein